MEVRLLTCLSFNENTYTHNSQSEGPSVGGCPVLAAKHLCNRDGLASTPDGGHTAYSISIFSDTSVMKNGTFYSTGWRQNFLFSIPFSFSFLYLLFIFFRFQPLSHFFSSCWLLIAHRKRCNNQNGICGAKRNDDNLCNNDVSSFYRASDKDFCIRWLRALATWIVGALALVEHH